MNCGGYIIDVSYRKVMYRVVYRVEYRLLVDTYNNTSSEHEFDEYLNATYSNYSPLVDLPMSRQRVIATDSRYG